jgi:hypothetical protein
MERCGRLSFFQACEMTPHKRIECSFYVTLAVLCRSLSLGECTHSAEQPGLRAGEFDIFHLLRCQANAARDLDALA